MALEKRPLVHVQIPVGDTDGEVAECVWRDVDAAGGKTVALHRRKGPIVPDDLGDRITRRHVAPPPPSYEMHGLHTGHSSGAIPEHWPAECYTAWRAISGPCRGDSIASW